MTLVTVSGPELTSEYHHAFEALPVGVCIIDRTGSIVSVNRALEQQLGYLRSELVGQDAALLLSIPIDAIESALRERSDSAARATASPAQLSGRRKDGTEFRADVDLRPFETVNGTFVLVSLDDRTPRRGSDTTPQSPIGPPTAAERLIADLSGQFINLPADEIRASGPIRSGTHLPAPRSLLGDDSPARTCRRPGQSCRVDRQGVPSLDDAVLNAEHFPWTLDRLLSGETVCFASTEDVPNEIDRRNYELLNTNRASRCHCPSSGGLARSPRSAPSGGRTPGRSNRSSAWGASPRCWRRSSPARSRRKRSSGRTTRRTG